MTEGIIGKKLGMTQVFREDGKAEAITAIEAGPCTVAQVKTEAKDGYNAAKLLIKHLEGVDNPVNHYIVGTELIERDSTK